MEVFDVVRYGLAHAGVAAGMGALTDSVFPAYNPAQSDILLGVEVLAQFIVSLGASTQLLLYLQPPAQNIPIGDGVAAFALFQVQKNWQRKVALAWERVNTKFQVANGLIPKAQMPQ